MTSPRLDRLAAEGRRYLFYAAVSALVGVGVSFLMNTRTRQTYRIGGGIGLPLANDADDLGDIAARDIGIGASAMIRKPPIDVIAEIASAPPVPSPGGSLPPHATSPMTITAAAHLTIATA